MSKAKILIVEDEVIVSKDLERRLLKMGFRVVGQEISGAAAIQKIYKTRPDLVLMDIKLSGEMDGIDVAEAINEKMDIPIVYLTAYSDEATLKRARISEPFGYILKPYQDREVKANIEMALYKHRIEKELKRYRLDLEILVLERTAKLLSTNEKLERALRVKTTFMQHMSHELRTPLNAILGFSDMLEFQSDDPLSDKQLNYIQNIQTGGKRLLRLVNNVLKLTEIEAGGVTPSPQQILIEDLFANIIQTVKSQVEEKDIQFHQNIPDQMLKISADPTHLCSVLLILLENAVKYTGNGGEIKLVALQSEDAKVNIRVIDSGIGFKPENISKLFAPFEQVEEDFLTGSDEGAGLSLALAKALVELNQGRIWAESEGEGKGSDFVIEFNSDVTENLFK
ncbi:MAG: response regulator [Anaerolineales bacterium]|nr:response regulator [Chloroflexota bacterium]MBL6981807.1 response regulator [Anaerolineales bacterium]